MRNTKLDGKKAEALAASYLEITGMKILERNYRCRQGEIDLVGKDGRYLVFIEVKARKSPVCGYPGEAVNSRKIKRICRAADYYCCQKKIGPECPIRFDVVELLENKLRHIKNAFDYC